MVESGCKWSHWTRHHFFHSDGRRGRGEEGKERGRKGEKEGEKGGEVHVTVDLQIYMYM